MDYNKLMAHAVDASKTDDTDERNQKYQFLIDDLDQLTAGRAPFNSFPELIEILRNEVFRTETRLPLVFTEVSDGNYAKFLEQYPEKFQEVIAIIAIFRYVLRTKNYANAVSNDALAYIQQPAIAAAA